MKTNGNKKEPMTIDPSRIDADHDGRISAAELHRANDILELDLREEKAETQKRMAWAAMASMVIFTIALFSPILSDSRVAALADLLGLFYIAQAGIVGAYMGVTAWMSNNGTNSSRYYGYGASYGGGSSSYTGSKRRSKRSVVAPDPDDAPIDSTDRKADL